MRAQAAKPALCACEVRMRRVPRECACTLGPHRGITLWNGVGCIAQSPQAAKRRMANSAGCAAYARAKSV
eukprot:5572292-Pleurochrysis_carterae.AAC.1